jgi:two-component system, OmpR family, sensor kinase
MRSAYSLKKRLIVYVSLVSIILGCILIFCAYRIALEETNEILDAQMQNLAERVADHDPSPTQSDIDMRKRYHEEDLFVDVWAYNEKNYPTHELDLLVKPVTKAGFYKHLTDNGIWYTYVLPLEHYQIQVSQQKSVRQHLALELAANMFIPYVLFLPFALFALGWGINRNLKPLSDFKEELSKRGANELEHIKTSTYPEEILPTIREMNHLFDRILLAQNEQKQFIADAAHELRTPLTALNLQMQILQQQRLDDPAIHNLSKGLDRVQHLVIQLLSLAKQDAFINGVDNHQEVDLNEVAVSCVEQLIQFALTKEIDLGVEQQQNIKLYAIESSIHSILYNLIDNAIKYTPKGGIINVSLVEDQDKVFIIVEDSGAGIDPQLYEKLTKRFYRTQNHEEIGSGLGLSIVVKAIEKHHGKLNFSKSENLGGLKVMASFPKKMIEE